MIVDAVSRQRVVERSAISILSLAVTFVFFINLCNAIYQCGCQSIWAGLARSCNIHTAGVKHCPWCSHGAFVYNSVLALVLIPQLLVCWLPGRWNWRPRFVAALFLFPLVGSLAAIVMGWADGYWA